MNFPPKKGHKFELIPLALSLTRSLAHLALVLARVGHLGVGDLERPDVVAGVVERREARVPRVADLADREDAQVAAANPRNL